MSGRAAGGGGTAGGGTAWVEVEGLRVAHESRGSGPPLALVHGWAADRTHWYRQAAAFPDHRVVTLDLPGHGESDKPERAYPMSLFARAVEAVLDADGCDTAVVVGHSNGLLVSRELYRRAPARVRALVGIDGWLRNPIPPAMAEWMRRATESPDYERMMQGMIEQTAFGSLDARDIERIKRTSLDTPVHVHRAGLQAMTDPAVWREDPIEVPLLLVHADSPRLPPDYEAFVRRLAPAAEYHVWEDVSHFIPLERHEALNALLRGFLSRLPDS